MYIRSMGAIMAPTHHPETPPHPTPTPPQPEVGSFRYHGCYDFVRTDQRGWDLLDFLDVMFVRMLHVYKEYGRYYGPHPPPRNPPHPTPTPPQPEVGSFRYHGCYDFVRADQRGWDLLGFLDVMFVRMLHVYKEYGSFYSEDIIRDRLCVHVRSFVCTCELDLRAHVRSLVCTCEFWPHLCVHVS